MNKTSWEGKRKINKKIRNQMKAMYPYFFQFQKEALKHSHLVNKRYFCIKKCGYATRHLLNSIVNFYMNKFFTPEPILYLRAHHASLNKLKFLTIIFFSPLTYSSPPTIDDDPPLLTTPDVSIKVFLTGHEKSTLIYHQIFESSFICMFVITSLRWTLKS